MAEAANQSSSSRDTARVLAALLTYLLLASGVRLWLAWSARADLADQSLGDLLGAALMGLRLDAVVAGYLGAVGAVLLLLPGAGRRAAVRLYGAILFAVAVGANLVELGYFAYFGFRPNYLVLEHGSDPEVWSAISGELLNARLFVEIGVLAAGAWLLRRALVPLLAAALRVRVSPERASHPWLHGLVLLPVALLFARGTLDHRPLNPSAAALGTNRVANEVASSGLFNVVYEAVRRRGDTLGNLKSVQDLLPGREARERARRVLSARGAFTGDGKDPLLRVVEGKGSSPQLKNAVVVVMESFSSRLVGVMGGELDLSPEFDALSREGLLLTQCYATGERTVQGLEAVLSSFPPLPGVSVVRRPEAQQGFATLASVLAQHGYASRFLYGGQGIFDHMRGFFLANGFDGFIEEKDYPAPRFKTSWGVSDEDLFHRANQEFEQLHQAGKPFIGALLTVSLHSPWDFPKGRAPELPEGTPVPEGGFSTAELRNFLYADFAVGEFIREARKLPYFKDTLFVFVADHPVHIRGHELLPADQFKIPTLLFAPGSIQPGRLDVLASQLDLAPTILGLLGQSYRTPFFGRDLFNSDPDSGLAIMVYDKKRYGVRRGDRLTVLTENRSQTYYNVGSEQPVEPSAEHREDQRDALAVLQVAEDLLHTNRFTSEPCSEPARGPARSTTAGLGCGQWKDEAQSQRLGGS